MQTKLLIFLLLSIPIVLVSRRPLKSYRNHGFYRFFGWECLLWITISNVPHWFENSFSPQQIASWIFLFYSAFIVIAGVFTMLKKGKAHQSREGEALYGFEKTTMLVDTGIFKYIRHPMYGSLIFLTLGIYFKNPELIESLATMAAVLLFYVTALREEEENIAWFGDSYIEYMLHTKKFVPYLW
jgi:protein-S-isoprenylcysteine O-methyltransferase Ste14